MIAAAAAAAEPANQPQQVRMRTWHVFVMQA
jgi:hypothetical protein